MPLPFLNDIDVAHPTPVQALLLRAALARDEDALTAWDEWKAAADLDHADLGTIRMLPLVYRNLSARLPDDPLMPICKGVYRRTWYENHLRLHDLAPALRALQQAGIDTVLLKGAALVLRWYADYGLRPMGDCDVLVPKERAHDAMVVLERAGFALDRSRRLPAREYLVRSIHSAPFRTKGDRALDLHWNVLAGCLQRGIDDELRRATMPIALEDVPTSVLGPTDQLLHVLLHGMRWDPSVPPFRWYADATIVLDAARDSIDWDRLVAEAVKRRRGLMLREALERWHALCGGGAPAEVRAQVARLPISAREREITTRMIYARHAPLRRAMEPQRFKSPLGLWYRYRRVLWAQYTDDELARLGVWPRVLGLCRYAQDDVGAPSLWHLPLALARKVARKPSVLRP